MANLQSLPTSLPKHCDVQPQYVYESTIHSHNLLSTLNDQRQHGLLCDITVIVEGIELVAHKAVLAACSSYFHGIITDPANVSHNIVLELSSITKVGMENLLEFAYTSKLTVSKDNVDHVLNAARELEVKNLEFSCLNLLKQKLLQDSAQSHATPTSFESQKACRNSTISRCLIPSQPQSLPILPESSYIKSPEVTSPSGLIKSSTNVHQLMPRGDCPLMSQLSLNPKPQLPIQTQLPYGVEKTSFCMTSLSQPQTVFKTLGPLDSSCGLFPQPEQLFKKQNPIVKMMTLCPSVNETKPNVTCSFLQPSLAMSCTEAPSQSKCTFSSNFNSDTDEALSAEEEDQKYKCPMSVADKVMACKSRKHPDVVLPLSIEEITKLPRSELQELLNKHPNLSVQQISAMHEIRRRGKNRIAAQRCRKRKMDCIRGLQCELDNLHKEHNELMKERKVVCENASKLSDLFHQRYVQVFSNILESCEKGALCDKNDDGKVGKENVVVSMAKYFRNEAEQSKKMVERFSKLPCSNIAPINWSCPMMNPDIVVVCDEEERYKDCYKPSSPSMCSNASFSSDLTETSSMDCTSIQENTCTGISGPPCHTVFSSECAEAISKCSANDKATDKTLSSDIKVDRTITPEFSISKSDT